MLLELPVVWAFQHVHLQRAALSTRSTRPAPRRILSPRALPVNRMRLPYTFGEYGRCSKGSARDRSAQVSGQYASSAVAFSTGVQGEIAPTPRALA